ncbi:MAG TPA: T9SS type A sorting domain-containing protein [Bacteroidetes bacterium]|nr:T9SS type A sorting domain-containing protein [Bacteroidota bacterium]
MKNIPILFLLTLSLQTTNAQNFTNAFPFTLPAFDSTTQEFLPHFEKHNIADFITTSADGQFMSAGQPIRFWGVNLTTGACFPQQTDAPGVAARMRKMGINLVRFHHMDNPWTSSEGSLFLQNGSTTSLNPVTLDRLHFFLAQLKAEGVYANINLNVSRTFTEGDGVLYADSIPEFGKGVTLFDGQLIHLQKEYARQLLTAVNPYTGLPIADDPVMAMLEIANENTLYGFWKDDQLQPFAEGGNILSRHSDTLDLKWNDFLSEKYGSQANLETAWQNGIIGTPEELVLDGGFESGDIGQQWLIELHETSQATIAASASDPYEGSYCAEVDVTQATGTDWHIQFEQVGASVEMDSTYTVRFFAKADSPRAFGAGAMRNAPPWTWYGGTGGQLTSQWREYSFSFTAPEANDGLVRITFSLGQEAGRAWFDEVSMALTQKVGLENGEDLALGNIRRIRYSERLAFHPQRVADMAEFYLQLQKDYYDGMHGFLTNELGVKVPITGSNALGGIYEPYTHGSLDYIDDHAYWNHPWFPNQPWSPWDWFTENQSMLGEEFLGTVPGIFGGLQVQGKPLTISEYNHPYPNIYQVEMLPILAGYGSFHGADGFMFFEYNGGDPADWTTDIQNNFFGLHRNTPVMALFPLFSYAFQKGLIQEDPNPVLVGYSPEYLFNMPQDDDRHRWENYYPYDQNIALTSSVRIGGFDLPQAEINVPQVGSAPFTAATDELVFAPQEQLLSIQTPRFECVAGQLENAPQTTGGQMQIMQGGEHGVVAWLSLTDEPLATSGRSLLALASRVQNQNMVWDGTTTVHDDWGSSPTEVQALDVELLLNIEADSIRIYPLDPVGQEAQGFVLLPQMAGEFLVNLNQNDWQSLWFGVEAFGTVTGSEEGFYDKKISVFPNPVSGSGRIYVSGLEGAEYRLTDMQGRAVQAGFFEKNILLEGVKEGMYFLVLKTPAGSVVEKVLVF